MRWRRVSPPSPARHRRGVRRAWPATRRHLGAKDHPPHQHAPRDRASLLDGALDPGGGDGAHRLHRPHHVDRRGVAAGVGQPLAPPAAQDARRVGMGLLQAGHGRRERAVDAGQGDGPLAVAGQQPLPDDDLRPELPHLRHLGRHAELPLPLEVADRFLVLVQQLGQHEGGVFDAAEEVEALEGGAVSPLQLGEEVLAEADRIPCSAAPWRDAQVHPRRAWAECGAERFSFAAEGDGVAQGVVQIAFVEHRQHLDQIAGVGGADQAPQAGHGEDIREEAAKEACAGARESGSAAPRPSRPPAALPLPRTGQRLQQLRHLLRRGVRRHGHHLRQLLYRRRGHQPGRGRRGGERLRADDRQLRQIDP